MKSLLTGILMLLSVMVAQAQQVVHTVQRGETLESIAEKYHVTKETITQNNPNAKDAFYVGLKLYIPTSQSANNPQNVGQPQSETIQEPTSSGNNDYSQNKQSEYSYSNNVEKTTNTSVFDPQKQEGAMDVQYHGIDNGWGIGVSGGGSYFLFGYDYYFGKKSEGMSSNMGMEIYAGGNYRYHITEYFYLEGRIFAGYYQWDTEFNKVKGYGLDDIKVREAFLGVSPRAGLRYKKVAISAGYRWDWVKFKFKKENCLDRFNIGLTFFFN
jgi:hypothetical protein